MNTPRSKQPKRWAPKRPPPEPSGEFITIGLAAHPIYATLLGHIAALWPHIDDAMAHVFRELLGAGETVPVRAVFRSIANTQVRMRILRNLLEETSANMTRGPDIDDIISEYRALNDIRNKYIHGLWYYYYDEMYLAEPALDDLDIEEKRKVSPKELRAVAERMREFAVRLRSFRMNQKARREAPPPESL